MGKIRTTVLVHSLSNFTCQLLMRTIPIDFGLRGQRLRSTLAFCVPKLLSVSCAQELMRTIQTTVLVQSLSNFICKLWMMGGGTLSMFSEPGQICLGSKCHSPTVGVMSKTLTLAITFKPKVTGHSYCTRVFLMARPFTWYHNL